MTISTSAGGVTIQSTAKNGTLSAQTLATTSSIEVVLDTGVGTNNGNLFSAGTTFIGEAAPTLIGRTMILRRGLGTEETRYITACTLVGGCTVLTVSEAWVQDPASGDTYDFCYTLDDTSTVTGITFGKKSGLYASSRRMILLGGTFTYLGIHDGAALETNGGTGSVIDIDLNSSAQLDIGYLFGGVGAQSGFVFPAVSAIAAAQPFILARSGSTMRFYDFVIRTTISNVKTTLAAGASATWERGKTFRISGSSEFTNLKASDVVFESTAIGGASTHFLRINSSSDFNQCRLIGTGGFQATAGSTLNIKNINFINNFRNITIEASQTWNVINPTWLIDTTGQSELQFNSSTANIVNELYSLDVGVADAGGSAIASAVVYVYEGTQNLDLPNFAITNASGIASTQNVLNETYEDLAASLFNVSYGDFALKVFKYGKLPFVATHPRLTERDQTVTLVSDAAASELSAASAINKGSAIGIGVFRESIPGTLIAYDTLTGAITLGVSVLAATSGAEGVIKEDTSTSSSTGFVFVSNRNATDFLDDEAVERVAAPGSALFTVNGSTGDVGVSGTNLDFTWHINASGASLGVTYNYLSARQAEESPQAIFTSSIQWGEDEQGLLVQLGGAGYLTERNVNLAEGVYVSNRGAGTAAFFTADDGNTFTPPVTVTFTLTGINASTEVRLIDNNKDFIAGEENVNDGQFDYTYVYPGVDVSAIAIVFHLNFRDIRLPVTLTNTSQSIPIQQQTDRVYSNPT
jgi:hypothetical protein